MTFYVVCIVFAVCAVVTGVRWLELHSNFKHGIKSTHTVCDWYFWVAVIAGLYMVGK